MNTEVASGEGTSVIVVRGLVVVGSLGSTGAGTSEGPAPFAVKSTTTDAAGTSNRLDVEVGTVIVLVRRLMIVLVVVGSTAAGTGISWPLGTRVIVVGSLLRPVDRD